MTNEELVKQLRSVAENLLPELFLPELLNAAAERIEEMGEYCLQMGVSYEQRTQRKQLLQELADEAQELDMGY